MKKVLDTSWLPYLEEDFSQDYFLQLESFVDDARKTRTIFPTEENVFRAFSLTGFERTRVVILGQDPYHDDGQAHGLSFSVTEGNRHPPSLRNIFKELESDMGIAAATSGDLSKWAEQGVLLLNTVLTVEAHQPHSHRNQGWEIFTDRVIAELGSRNQHTVFILWGKPAQTKTKWIDEERHTILRAPHPSPLSAHRGFFGSRPFSQANQALAHRGQQEIDWKL